MNEDRRINEILTLINTPAFAVINNRITHCNEAAQKLSFVHGIPIASLLQQNQTDYLEFQRGCLYTTLTHNNHFYSASVVRIEETNIFILDDASERIELGAFALTAANMRQPLSAMITAANNLATSLENKEDPKIRSQLKQMNQNIYRMHRMLCNMADAALYLDRNSKRMAYENVVVFVERIFKKAQHVCANSGIRFEYSVPDESIMSTIEMDILERGIYNMISNAIKYSDVGSVIQAELIQRDQRIYISIKDEGVGIPSSVINNIFKSYNRRPGGVESRSGMGLGLVLVRSAAKAHGGIIIIEQPEQKGTKITLSFPIRQGAIILLRTNATNVDYASGWDHGLLELSDVLPSDLY